MQVEVTFLHMESSEALKSFAAKQVARIEKYVHAPTDAKVVLSVEKHEHRAEINVSANGVRIRGEKAGPDMYGSIDGAAQKIERQLKRYRQKLATHKPREGHAMKVRHNVLAAQASQEGEVVADAPAQVLKREEVEARPMLVEEAIMQMDLLHEDVHVFTNAKTDAVNVLYRLRNGGFGLIEASTSTSNGRH
jgi:putative sigma-54 modulation protein